MGLRTVKRAVNCRRLTHVRATIATYWIRVVGRETEFYCPTHYHSRMNELYNSDTRKEHGALRVAD